MITYFDAVHALVGGAMTGHPDGPVSGIIFCDGQIPPSESAITEKLAELQAAEPIRLLREKRTLLLAETDWVVIRARENGGQVPVAWKTYRQALRDLPSGLDTVEKVNAVTWPTKPS